MVAVGAPAVGIVELGDHGEIAGAFGQAEIGTEAIRADRVDPAGSPASRATSAATSGSPTESLNR